MRPLLLLLTSALFGCSQQIASIPSDDFSGPIVDAVSIVVGEAGTDEIALSKARWIVDPLLVAETVQAIQSGRTVFADHLLLEGWSPAVLLDRDQHSVGAYVIDLSAATDQRPVLRPAVARRTAVGYSVEIASDELPSKVPAIPAPFLKPFMVGSTE